MSQARLARRELPRCSSDGIVKHVLTLDDLSSWLPCDADADIEWVLMGSNSTSNTPTKIGCKSLKHKTNYSMQPQVSFDVSSYSDSSVPADSQPSNQLSIKQQDSDTCEDCVISRPNLTRRKRGRNEKFQPRIYTSGSSSTGESIRSDDSQGMNSNDLSADISTNKYSSERMNYFLPLFDLALDGISSRSVAILPDYVSRVSTRSTRLTGSRERLVCMIFLRHADTCRYSPGKERERRDRCCVN